MKAVKYERNESSAWRAGRLALVILSFSHSHVLSSLFSRSNIAATASTKPRQVGGLLYSLHGGCRVVLKDWLWVKAGREGEEGWRERCAEVIARETHDDGTQRREWRIETSMTSRGDEDLRRHQSNDARFAPKRIDKCLWKAACFILWLGWMEPPCNSGMTSYTLHERILEPEAGSRLDCNADWFNEASWVLRPQKLD